MLVMSRSPKLLTRQNTTNLQFLAPELVVPLGLNLSDAAITVRDNIRLSGPDIMDVDSEDDEVDLDAIDPNVNLDDLVDRIWAQFAVDLIAVSPNYKPRKGEAYTTLSPEQRVNVSIDLYKRPVFPFRAGSNGIWGEAATGSGCKTVR